MDRLQVPQNVKRQKDEADKLLEDFEKGMEGNPEEPTPPAETLPAEPKPGEGTPPAVPPTPPTPPAPTEDAEKQTLKQQNEQLIATITELQKVLADENRDTWKHKYDVMAGKHRAETAPALRRVHELETEVTRLKNQLDEAAKVAKSAAPTAEAELNEDEKAVMEDLGVDEKTFRRMKKLFVPPVQTPTPPVQPPAPPVTEPPQPPEKPELEPPTPKEEPVKIAPERQAYLTLLDVKAKGWREAMNSDGFKKFLKDQPSRYYGLVAADKELDATAVAEVYNAYFKTVAPAPEPPDKQPSREAAPSSSKGGSGSPVETDQWPLERIAQFENDVATGKIKMGSEEYKKLKASRDEFLSHIRIV